MAWSYRKRIKIAPGVHINLSKSGISTSVGPTGAKVTFGPKGTYLHTSIPGTGIYSRKKIGSGFGSTDQALNLSSISSNNGHTSSVNNNEDKRGCLRAIFWGLLVIWLVLIGVMTAVIINNRRDLADTIKEYETLAESKHDPSSSISGTGTVSVPFFGQFIGLHQS